jgi:hypothetical protein
MRKSRISDQVRQPVSPGSIIDSGADWPAIDAIDPLLSPVMKIDENDCIVASH